MDYTLHLTAEQLDIIGRSLIEMPYKMTAQLIADINKQVSEQDKPNESTSD